MQNQTELIKKAVNLSAQISCARQKYGLLSEKSLDTYMSFLGNLSEFLLSLPECTLDELIASTLSWRSGKSSKICKAIGRLLFTSIIVVNMSYQK